MALINVAKANTTCPICGKNDWCMVSEDGKLALCQRIANDHPNKKGGWWHSLEDKINYNKNTFNHKKVNRKAPDVILDSVYNALLEHSNLNYGHKKALELRGISRDEMNFYSYKSLEIQGRYNIAKKLKNRYGDKIMKHIPGFYIKEGKYGDYLSISGGTGFMIPIRNLQNHICGIQIRVDKPTKNTKYIWLSSADKREGSNSETPLHIAIPPNIESEDIWITEGPLKGNILSWRKKCIVIAAPGIAHWRNIPDTIIKTRKKYHMDGKVFIAYDADYKDKLYVKESAQALHNSLEEKDLNSLFAIWNIHEGKGIDDVIVNNGMIYFSSSLK